MKNAAHSWLHSLSLRPLLWIAPATVLGCSLGATLASSWLPVIWIAVFCGITTVISAIFCWRKGYFWPTRCILFLLLVALFCGYTAKRISPPKNDLSVLVNHAEVTAQERSESLQLARVQLKGYVSQTPYKSTFIQEFPLKSTFVKSDGKVLSDQGNVWVQAPLGWNIHVGDFVQLSAGLRDLPLAGSPTEKNTRWRYVLAHCWSMVRLSKGDSWKVLSAPRPWQYQVDYQLAGWRKWLLNLYQQRFQRYQILYPKLTAKVMVAMVFGDGALSHPLPWLVKNNFRSAGLTHLLVASGTQVSLLVLMILGIFKGLGLRRWPWLMLLVLLPILTIYALLVGGAASIWRAFIAGICVTVALLLGRAVDVLSLWCLALVALLAIDPLQIFNLSFQLTFAATWGLIVIAPAILRWVQNQRSDKRRFGNGIIIIAAYTLAAQLATIPMLIYHFGNFSIAAMGTNLAGVPIAGFLVGSGIVGIAVPWLALPNAWLTQFVFGMTAFTGQVGWLWQHGIHFSLGGVLFLYGTLLLIPAGEEVLLIAKDEWQRWKTKITQRWSSISLLRAFVWCGFLASLMAAALVFQRSQAGLEVILLDVGQGESIVVRSPSGRTVLVDGGSEGGPDHGQVANSVILPYLASRGVRRLDAVLLTHADSDHCNALDEVVNGVPVSLFIDGAGRRFASGKPHNISQAEVDYWRLRDAVTKHHIPRKNGHVGQTLDLGDGVKIHILAPLRPVFEDDNNRSLVAKVTYGKTSVLLTGDMQAQEENQLLRRGVNVHCTILKVAHHGSATSSTQTFLKAANPAAAIISCGRYNRFGHPAPSTMERFRRDHITAFRTDLQGTIDVTCDGSKCRVHTFR